VRGFNGLQENILNNLYHFLPLQNATETIAKSLLNLLYIKKLQSTESIKMCTDLFSEYAFIIVSATQPPERILIK
jgi:hypothetical protein